MFAKLLKIIALGLGGVITTGIPSGTISTASGQYAAVTMAEPYKLQNHDQVWQQGGEQDLQYRSVVAADLVDYGAPQDICELEEAPDPQNTTLPGLGETAPKRDNKTHKAHKPLSFPVSRVSIATPIPAVSRWVGDRSPAHYDGCGAPLRSGTLFQPPAPELQYAGTASYEWWLGGLDNTFVAKWPMFLALCEGQNAPGGNGPPAPPGATSGAGTTVVPEPAGFLAILAGLPGLTIITRRRKRRIV